MRETTSERVVILLKRSDKPLRLVVTNGKSFSKNVDIDSELTFLGEEVKMNQH